MMTVEMKPLPDDLIDALLENHTKPDDLIGQNGLLKQLTKALVERALQAEMTDHLGHSKNQLVANEAGNARNGRSQKTLKGDFGALPIEIPRDRAGTFEPQLIPEAPDPLEALYPIVYLDCIHVKMRDNGAVRVKALYLAIGVNLQGLKEVLGLWMAPSSGCRWSRS
jgi:putative transposase